MKTPSRTFQKTVALTSEAQYRVLKDSMRLLRWRLVVDGEPLGWNTVSSKEIKLPLIAGWRTTLPLNYRP